MLGVGQAKNFLSLETNTSIALVEALLVFFSRERVFSFVSRYEHQHCFGQGTAGVLLKRKKIRMLDCPQHCLARSSPGVHAWDKSIVGCWTGKLRIFLSRETNTSIALGKALLVFFSREEKLVCSTAPSIAFPGAALVLMLGTKVYLAVGQSNVLSSRGLSPVVSNGEAPAN